MIYNRIRDLMDSQKISYRDLERATSIDKASLQRYCTGKTANGRGVGFYFRNVTELLLFGIKGNKNRTLAPARSQVNLLRCIKREHSRKPDEFIPLIEACSPGPYLEMFARGIRDGWTMWGNQASDDYEPNWATYKNHTIGTADK